MKRAIIGCTILLALAGVWSLGLAQTQPGDNKGGGDIRLIDSLRGEDLYKAYCAPCHGIDGRGTGPMAKLLKVPPADLTRITARSKGVFPLSRVSQVIAGEAQLPGHGNQEMPVWGPIFSRIESDRDFGRVRIDNLAQYLLGMQRL